MEPGTLFSEYSGTPVDVRDARRTAREALLLALQDVISIPNAAKAGLRRDWGQTASRLSAASLIRRNPAAAIGVALIGGFFVGRKFFEENRNGSTYTTFRNVVRQHDARGLARSMALQLAAAAVSRVLSEHGKRSTAQHE